MRRSSRRLRVVSASAISVLCLVVMTVSVLLSPAQGVRITPSDLSSDSKQEEEEARDKFVRSLRQQRRLAEAASTSSPPLSPSDHLVTDLPLVDYDDYDQMRVVPRMHAGHLNASPDGHKKLFYWLVSPPAETGDVSDAEIPLLIWLNGGPGCSSMEGFFLENGPLRFALVGNRKGNDGGGGNDGDAEKEWKLVPNPYSWHLSPAYVLYIDQPVGTGLSFTTRGDYCKNDDEVNADFVYFLEEFLLFHKDAFLMESSSGGGPPSMKRPLFFSGESHAGHYIPSMIDHILTRQAPPRQGGGDGGASPSPSLRVRMDVRGAAIGNGWVDPYHQYAAAEAAYGSGLVSLAQRSQFDDAEKQCQAKLENGNLKSSVCFDLLDAITAQSHGGSGGTVACKYDVTKYLPRGGRDLYPPGNEIINAYLGGYAAPTGGHWNLNGNEDALNALHATESVAAKQRYKGCTDPPYFALAHQDGLGVVPQVVRILDDDATDVRLLFFNGMNDLVCNHVGNELFLAKLPWGRAKEWTEAQRFAWRLDDDASKPPTGYVQEVGKLSFLKIPGAGHMVPMDQPAVALAMMRTFLYGRSFLTSKQNLGSKDPTEKSC